MKLKLFFLTISVFLVVSTAFAQNDDKKIYRSKVLTVNGLEFEVSALLLDSGRITLFKAIDYYAEISSNGQPFIIKLIKEDKQYINQFKEWMGDCPSLARLIHKTKFTSEDLTNIVRLYNNCSSLDKEKLYRPTVSAALGFGLPFIFGVIDSKEGFTKGMDWSFKKLPVIYFSVFLTPPHRKNISIGMETSFSKRTLIGYELENDPDESFVYERFANTEYTQLTASVKLIHTLSSNKRIRPFYSLGLGSSFVGNAKTQFWEVHSYTYNDNVFRFINEVPSDIKPKISPLFGVALGAKTYLKEKYSIQFEVQFHIQPNQISGNQVLKGSAFAVTPILKFGLK